MRIISGIAKGLHLKTPPGRSRAIRPTSDRCREALFSILGNRPYKAHILDLYAGTGAFGLEAISRGAESAVFVDNSATALSLVAHNTTLLQKYITEGDPGPHISIIKSDLRKGLNSVITSCSESIPFDIVFLDPPYQKGLAEKSLVHLDNANILGENGVIIAEERSNVLLPDKLKMLKLKDKRKYGDTCFWLYII